MRPNAHPIFIFQLPSPIPPWKNWETGSGGFQPLGNVDGWKPSLLGGNWERRLPAAEKRGRQDAASWLPYLFSVFV